MNDLVVTQLVEALGAVATSIYVLGAIIAATFAVAYFTVLTRAWLSASRPDLFKFNVERAVELYETDKLQQLIDYAKTCLDKYPNDVDARWYLGIGYYGAERFGEALGEFETVVRLNPHWKEPAAPYIEEINQRLDLAYTHSREQH